MAEKNSQSQLRRYECRVRSRLNPQKMEMVTVDAEDKEEALSQLHHKGHLVVSIHEPESTQRAMKSSMKQVFAVGKGRKTSSFMNSVSTRELIFFAVQLSTLLKSGIALVRALEILERGTPNAYLADAVTKMKKTVSEGHSLAEALKHHPKIFPWLWNTLVEVGEITGTLPSVLEEIASYQEAAERIKGKVVSALFYPAVLLTVAGGAVTFLLIVIVPKFEEIFKSQNMQLPVITQIVLGFSKMVTQYYYFVILAIIVMIFLFRMHIKSPVGRISFARNTLRMPIFGNMLMMVSVVRFCRGLGTLLTAGIPLLKGLEISARLSSNAYIEKTVNESAVAVAQGHGLGVQLESRKVFPVFMTQLVSVGEETGEVQAFLKLLADYYEEQVNQLLSRLSTLIEPVMLVFMAVIVGIIVISMFLPIVQLSTGG